MGSGGRGMLGDMRNSGMMRGGGMGGGGMQQSA